MNYNFYPTKLNKIKGFTVVELLVVISIIGVLASVILTNLDNARGLARDAVRILDMREIQTGLALYYFKNNTFPPAITDTCTGAGGWDYGPCTDGAVVDNTFISDLVTGGYMPIVPVDPLGDTSHHYRYYVYNAGTFGCPVEKGRFYVLGVHSMESNDTGAILAHHLSPGWSCDPVVRDWQNEFDWVTGGFE